MLTAAADTTLLRRAADQVCDVLDAGMAEDGVVEARAPRKDRRSY